MAKRFIACSIDGCKKPFYAKAMCQMHYARNRTHGDPNFTIGTVRGDVRRFYEEVVLHYEGDECLEWPYHRRGRSKYAGMQHNGRMSLVSRVLCEEIYGPPPSERHEAAHSCGNGDKSCVAKRHLSWKTPVENQADRLIHGTHNRGERSGGSKLTEAQARDILSTKGKEARGLVAKRLGISISTVTQIRSGRSWSWLQEPS